MEGSLKRKLESNKPGVPAKKLDAGSEEPEHSGGPKVSIPFGFKDSNEIYVLKDLGALKKFNRIFESFQGRTDYTLTGEPMKMNSEIKPGKFILESLPEAVMVQDMDFNKKPDYFEKMLKMTKEELLVIHTAATFHECKQMQDSAAAAIASLIAKGNSIAEIGKFLGAAKEQKKEFKDNWCYPAVDTSKD